MTSIENNIALYTWPNGEVSFDVNIKEETLWLSLTKIWELFGRDKSGISRHIKKIYESEELPMVWTVAKNATVQTEGGRQVSREEDYYNLDMILSVWYRVNSRQATHFRKRATQTLKQHITQWYTINQSRLEQTGLDELSKSLWLVRRALESKELSNDETKWLLDLIVSYMPGLSTLQKFDKKELPESWWTNESLYTIDKLEAVIALAWLKAKLIAKWEATDIFAQPKDDNGIDSVFGAMYQTYDGIDLYPSVEEKAAHLLYLVIKNHPFVDGNKRSWSFLFVRYLSKNGILIDHDGKEKISHQTMVALALLIATSDPSEKDMMVRLVVALLG